MDARGWDDLAYSECFGLSGDVYEARSMLHRTAANGTNKANRDYLAFCLLLGDGQAPTEAMVTSVRERISVLRAFQPDATAILGHQNIKPTTCPGDEVMRLIGGGFFEPDAPAIPPAVAAVGPDSFEAVNSEIAALYAEVEVIHERLNELASTSD